MFRKLKDGDYAVTRDKEDILSKFNSKQLVYGLYEVTTKDKEYLIKFFEESIGFINDNGTFIKMNNLDICFKLSDRIIRSEIIDEILK